MYSHLGESKTELQLLILNASSCKGTNKTTMKNKQPSVDYKLKKHCNITAKKKKRSKVILNQCLVFRKCIKESIAILLSTSRMKHSQHYNTNPADSFIPQV